MDRTKWSILIGLLVVLGMTLLVLMAAFVIPFEVEQPASIKYVTGVAGISSPGDSSPATIDPAENEIQFRVGQKVQVEPGSTATVIFFNQGRALLTGPATLTLIESYRRSTLTGHAAQSGGSDRDYVLTLEQSGGSIQYDFANTDPAFEDIKITVRLPNGNYTPTSPCWTSAIGLDGSVTTTPLDC